MMSSLTRKYLQVEKTLRQIKKNRNKPELKASLLEKEEKRKLYRVCRDCYKFVVIVKLKNLDDKIFENSKTKQRFLEYAYKYGVKQLLQKMRDDNILSSENEIELRLYADEYRHASNEKYSLSDIIFNEFKYGVYVGYDVKPIVRNLTEVSVTYCNSENIALIRASDILANRAYHEVSSSKMNENGGDRLLVTSVIPQKTKPGAHGIEP